MENRHNAFQNTFLAVGLSKTCGYVTHSIISMHFPDHILQCRSSCAFGQGLDSISATTFQQIARQDIDSPHDPQLQNKMHALQKGMAWKGYRKSADRQ